jgi:hypothetical protein
MSKYTTPVQYFFPLHHVRPRFKNDVENTLFFMAFGISELGAMPKDNFNKALNTHIRGYGSNAVRTLKTVNNWRTEIPALFNMCKEVGGTKSGTIISSDLANTSDLPQFFRNFIYAFQYPGGHLNSEAISEILTQKVSFHPGRWLATLFLLQDDVYITVPEFCHCVLNDLRVTRDHESVRITYERILENRRNSCTYIKKGDVIRYGGDILDYMVLACLVVKGRDGRFFKKNETTHILKMIRDSKVFFNDYAKLGGATSKQIKGLRLGWILYAEQCVLELSAQMRIKPKGGVLTSPATIPSESADGSSDSETAKTGERGECLSLTHEVLRVKAAGRDDLIHLIKRIPTHLAVGYDIKSFEAPSDDMRVIEVKTSISKAKLSFNRIHLTTNEWRTAEDLGDKYYVYRLQIDDTGCTLFVIRNPVRKYKQDILQMIPRDGADIMFADNAGEYVELLCAP